MEIKTDQITALLKEQLEKYDSAIDISEIGEIIELGDGVARASGLENVMSSELVELPNDVFGMALNLEEDNVGLVLFGETRLIKEGDIAKRTGRVVEVPVGKEMLGRVVNPLGQPLDGKGPISSSSTLPIERKALGVMARSPVKEPLQTGIKAIDSMVSDISFRTKNGISDIHLFEDNDKLVEWLTTLHDKFGSNANPNCSRNVILPKLNDGTLHAENVLGSIVKKYGDTVDANSKMLLEHNMDGDPIPTDIGVIFGMSKWSPETVYSKMNSIRKIYKMRDTFYKFLSNIELMVKKKNVFIQSGTIPKIDFGGFINPWKTLEKYGWPYKGIITWTNHATFNEVVIAMEKDGMISDEELGKLKI